RFTPEHVAAAVRAGRFTDEANTSYLTTILLGRQHMILARYFSRLSPLADVAVDARSVCMVDLARYARVYADSRFRYGAEVAELGAAPRPLPVRVLAGGRVCVDVKSTIIDPRVHDDSERRYRVVTIDNGTGAGPVLLHFYDLGRARGLRLAGIERR